MKSYTVSQRLNRVVRTLWCLGCMGIPVFTKSQAFSILENIKQSHNIENATVKDIKKIGIVKLCECNNDSVAVFTAMHQHILKSDFTQ